MCEYLRERIKGLKVVNGDISDLNPLDGEFDLVFSFRSFKYVLNQRRALYNIKKLLKKGGYAVLEMPNLFNPFYFFLYGLAPFLVHFTDSKLVKYFILTRFISVRSFTRELTSIGLSVERIEPLFFFPHFVYGHISSKKALRIVHRIGNILSKVFPRSLVFVARNE
jgi:SAM-dependent methyltransferase